MFNRLLSTCTKTCISKCNKSKQVQAVVKGSEIRWRRRFFRRKVIKCDRTDPYGVQEPILFTPNQYTRK